MLEKRFSECRDKWVVYYQGKTQSFETEELADQYLEERKNNELLTKGIICHTW